MPKKPSIKDRIQSALLNLASTQPISRVSYQMLSEAAEVDKTELLALYPARMTIVDDIMARLHEDVVDGFRRDSEESVRDNLFDLLMSYFEKMQENRDFFLNLERHLQMRPHLICQRRAQIRQLFEKMILRCVPDSRWMARKIKARGLEIIFWATYRAWRTDTSDDLAATMAELDKRLNMGEQWVQMRCNFMKQNETKTP